MNASQFRTQFVAFALFNAAVAGNRETGRDSKAALLRHAATLTDAQKREEDRFAVGAIAAKFGVKAQPMEQRVRYSGMTFAKDSAAEQALKRTRAMLKPANAAEAEEIIAKMVQVHNSADPVASMLAKFDKLTGGQKRSFLAKLNAAR